MATHRVDRLKPYHRLETMSKGCILFVFALFIAALFASFFIGLLPPAMSVLGMHFTWGCPSGYTDYVPGNCSGVDLAAGQTSNFSIPELSVYNQAVRLFAVPHNRNPNFGWSRKVSITVSAVGHGSSGTFIPEDKERSWLGTHERTLRCSVGSSDCDPILLFIAGVYAKKWDFTVTLKAVDQAAPNPFENMGDVRIQWAMSNPGFVTYQFFFRYAELFITLVAMIALAVSFCYVKGHLRQKTGRPVSLHADQSWTMVLVIGVILLNNPFFAARALTGGWFWTFIDSAFSSTCTALFMLHLLILFGGFITARRGVCQFYLPRLVLVGIWWAINIALLSLQTWNDPTATWAEIKGARELSICNAIFFVLWALWYLYTTARFFVQCKRSWVRAREARKAGQESEAKAANPIKGRYLALFLFVHLVVAIFVATNVFIFFVPLAFTQAVYLLIYTIINAYVWCLALFLAPSIHEPVTSVTLRDAENPKRVTENPSGGFARFSSSVAPSSLSPPVGTQDIQLDVSDPMGGHTTATRLPPGAASASSIPGNPGLDDDDDL